MRTLRLGAGLALVLVCMMAVAPAAWAPPLPGGQLWSMLSGMPGDDYGRAVAVNPAGDFVYAADFWNDGDPAVGCFSITAAGTTGFSAAYGMANGVPDSAAAMAMTADGAPRIVGSTRGALAHDDYLLARFGVDGSFLDAETFDDPANFTDDATAVAVDSSGATYVTGSSQSRRRSGDFDIVTVKYDAAGTKMWAKRFDAAQNQDRAVAVAVRGSAVYVTGRSRRAGHADDIAVLKYDVTSGRQLWSRFYDDTLHRNDAPSDLVVTSSGVYVGGTGRFATGKPSDAVLVKFTSAGTLKWAKYQGGSGRDAWSDLQAGSDGLIRATGTIARAATGADVMTGSWRADGTLAWRATFSSVGVFADLGVALTLDADGNVFVACSAENDTLDRDIRVLAYTPQGSTLWTSQPFAAFAGQDDVPADIAVSGTTVVVVGTSGTPAGDDYLVVSFLK